MAVISNGEYDAPKGILFPNCYYSFFFFFFFFCNSFLSLFFFPGVIYYFPVTCSQGQWKIVKGLAVSDFSKEKMNVTAQGCFFVLMFSKFFGFFFLFGIILYSVLHSFFAFFCLKTELLEERELALGPQNK
jgi:hypothetical protein